MITQITIFLLTTIEVIAALLLIGIILIQQSKSGGGLTAMGGGMTESVFGASAANVLTKGTVTLATLFLGTTLILAVITGHRGPRRSVAEDISAEPPAATQSVGEAAESTTADQPAAPAPDAGTTPAPAPATTPATTPPSTPAATPAAAPGAGAAVPAATPAQPPAVPAKAE